MVSSRLCAFMESEGDFPRHQQTYRKGLRTCDALFSVACVKEAALDRGSEIALVQIDFSAIDHICHSGFRFKKAIILGFLVERVTELKVLGVILDTKMTLECHIRLIAAFAPGNIGIMRKCSMLV